MYIYLASPYTHPDRAVRIARVEAAKLACVHLFNLGKAVYSPIVHWHAIAESYDLPGAHDPWLSQNEAMLYMAVQMKVLKLPGWERSKGIQREWQFALDKLIAADFLEPSELEYERWKEIMNFLSRTSEKTYD